MELHVPVSHLEGIGTKLSQGLDVVVLDTRPSTLYDDHVMLILAGNPRDLSIAAERAAKLGGVVD